MMEEDCWTGVSSPGIVPPFSFSRCYLRQLILISSVALAGCASSKTATSAPTPATAATGASTPLETVRISASLGGGTSTIETHPASGPTKIAVGFSADRVWRVLKIAYDSLAIPVSTLDPSARTIGNGSLRIRRRLGDVAVSKYINCGNTQGGSSADV